MRFLSCLVLVLVTTLAFGQVQEEKKSAEDKKAPPEFIPRPKPIPPVPATTIEDAIKRGQQFLLQAQNKDGSWGAATMTKDLNIYAPVPGAHLGFRSAVTALCIMALIETAGDDPTLRKSLERGEAWLMENLPQVRRANADAIYNVWSHGYGIQALVRMHQRLPQDKERQKKIEELIKVQYDYLDRYESVDGGWGYYDMRVGSKKPSSDSTSFTTATILIAMYEAKTIGVEPPEKLVKRAIDSVVRQRKPDFSYLYGEYLKWHPMLDINRPGGSLGRSQACNLALRLWGDKKVTEQVMIDWLDRLITRNGWLDMGRKRPIPHESHFMVAGYFYYYGHYYAALCMDQLDTTQRPGYQDHLANILLPKQEKDGSWWDYPLYNYHKPYGTAFVLLTLKRCVRATSPVAPNDK
jgi:hypothetical protein